MKISSRFLLISGIAALPMLAQMKPAPVLNIYRETIKGGKAGAHEKTEAEWAAYYRRTKAPGNYVGFTTMSGTPQAWFVTPMASFAQREENDKAFEKEPLKTGNAALAARDGEFRSASQEMWGVYRPDLTYKVEGFNPAKDHYLSVATYRVRIGHEQDFGAAVKTYMAASAKAGIQVPFICYQMVMGAQAGTYMFFTGMPSISTLDGNTDRMKALAEAMGIEKFAAFDRSSADFLISVDTTLLEVKTAMSYAPPSFPDIDAAFWKPAPAPKPVAPAPASAK